MLSVASPDSVLPVLVQAAEIAGVVRSGDGPVADATVRVQGTALEARSDRDGRFTIVGVVDGVAVTVSAWAAGFYCARIEGVVPPVLGLEVSLRRYQTGDNRAYRWIPPQGGDLSCASCKTGVMKGWIGRDAHGMAATNRRFLSMYNGTDILGNQSPRTRYVFRRDYGRAPLRPDPARPFYGPGYKLDFPTSAGNCATCHVPGAAVNSPYATDPTKADGADSFGVHCDFCHKIADVRLEAASGLPAENMPGVMSMDIRRPFPDDPERPQLFFGSFDDPNVADGDTYLPLLAESRYCAPCHFGSFWGTIVYNSFGEWLDSPYSDPSFPGAKTCQQCHMPAPAMVDGEPLTNVAPGPGCGIERAASTIHSHAFPGASDPDLLRQALVLRADARLDDGRVRLDVTVSNETTGHHVPTDSPLRQVILLVRAIGRDGAPLSLLEGPTLPAWCGIGDPAGGYYAGLPGKAFAKVLQERWTEIAPTGAYWNPTRLLSDTRIPALATDVSSFVFATPPEGHADVEVKLLFRRAFRDLSDLKRWGDPDFLMASTRLAVEHGTVSRLEP